ncbi:Uncharacterized conserved protein PhnB, glyoxalase superfamily [Nocardioides scoriae]|uniref:Uncharacterized conserved protein PhnB, glyoxalase superfamily n=1 Tax=Nocardioides scoriae TaxID=642780 RepID=A0A1H1V2K2_9ACTN|nr:VOC family protein [Nocardioides scoriae]SDS78994.1 Uncharacterized conserved protein PhnB, glyoxalase superfamily [Nocardioides scoriae]
MQVTQVGAAYAVAEPTEAGRWFAEHLGFEVLVDLGWYVSTRHAGCEGLRVDLVARDHETWVEPADGVRGAMLALVVTDVDSHHDRLVAAGVEVLEPLVTEPWGQRRVQLAGPDGLVVELVGPVEPDPAWMAAQGLAG